MPILLEERYLLLRDAIAETILQEAIQRTVYCSISLEKYLSEPVKLAYALADDILFQAGFENAEED